MYKNYIFLFILIQLIFRCGDPKEFIPCKISIENKNIEEYSICGLCGRYSNHLPFEKYNYIWFYLYDTESDKSSKKQKRHFFSINKDEVIEISSYKDMNSLKGTYLPKEYIIDYKKVQENKRNHSFPQEYMICSITYYQKHYNWSDDLILDCEINVEHHPNFNNEPVTIKIKIEKDKSNEDDN